MCLCACTYQNTPDGNMCFVGANTHKQEKVCRRCRVTERERGWCIWPYSQSQSSSINLHFDKIRMPLVTKRLEMLDKKNKARLWSILRSYNLSIMKNNKLSSYSSYAQHVSALQSLPAQSAQHCFSDCAKWCSLSPKISFHLHKPLQKPNTVNEWVWL